MGTDGPSRRPEIGFRRISGAQRPDYQYYGRRQGHRLRPGRRWLLANRLPALRLPPSDDGEAVSAACSVLCDRFEELWLEIGFGGGEHLIHQSEFHPTVAFIGGDPFQNGLARVIAEIDARGLDNIRLIDDDVRPWLRTFPEACIGRVFILFPDPWPKSRHHKRRILTAANLDQLARVMCDGGELRFASDDMGYIRWALDQMIRHPAFSWTARSARDWRIRPSDAIATRYEQKAKRAGRACAFLNFQRRTRRATPSQEA